ncbi:alpha/beta hydrolase family protein, partial [candidate division KSB1 bacterium]
IIDFLFLYTYIQNTYLKSTTRINISLFLFDYLEGHIVNKVREFLNPSILLMIVILLLSLSDYESANAQRRPPDVDRHEWSMRQKAKTDSTYEALCEDVLDYRKTSYRSNVGDLDIPVYIFQPLEKRGKAGHAALVWVHENLHGDLYSYYFPFIKEACDRGYVVIAPEYRGSTGYGEDFYNKIDYGGYEVDDVVTAVDYLRKNLPHVDMDRVGIIGWSHGGMITILSTTRNPEMFKASAAIVPVTNLVFRLAFKGEGYMRNFENMPRVDGRPHEKRDIFLERSPLYQVDKLQSPMLVHLADSDTDVNYEEAEQLIWYLAEKKKDLVELKVYHNPTGSSGGHGFSRIVNRNTFEREDTAEQRDSWNRTWTFFEWYLRPYEGK